MKFSDIFYAGHCPGFLVAFGAATMIISGVPAWIVVSPAASDFFFRWLFTPGKSENTHDR